MHIYFRNELCDSISTIIERESFDKHSRQHPHIFGVIYGLFVIGSTNAIPWLDCKSCEHARVIERFNIGIIVNNTFIPIKNKNI